MIILYNNVSVVILKLKAKVLIQTYIIMSNREREREREREIKKVVNRPLSYVVSRRSISSSKQQVKLCMKCNTLNLVSVFKLWAEKNINLFYRYIERERGRRKGDFIYMLLGIHWTCYKVVKHREQQLLLLLWANNTHTHNTKAEQHQQQEKKKKKKQGKKNKNKIVLHAKCISGICICLYIYCKARQKEREGERGGGLTEVKKKVVASKHLRCWIWHMNMTPIL